MVAIEMLLESPYDDVVLVAGRSPGETDLIHRLKNRGVAEPD